MTKKSTASAQKLRRKLDPKGTHERILVAAREVLAQDGLEGLSIDQVIKRAGVNRSTAYQHFPTRERLVEAAKRSVSDNLCEAVFETSEGDRPRETTVQAVTEHIARFAMDNSELGCVWLAKLLTLQRPANDRFFRLYMSHLEDFAKTEYAQPGIDAEVHAVMMLAATFLWPVWAQGHTLDPTERQQMANRFAREMLRLSLRGVLRSKMSRSSM